jgi:hypothetical protein
MAIWMIAPINNYIQRRLQKENLQEVTLVTAAKWLEEANILKDGVLSPGYPLRRHLYRGNIFGAYKKGNYYWYIKRIEDYQEILSTEELSEIFGLKSRTSLYRKIRKENIPFVQRRRKGIYFKQADVIKWALERDRLDVVEKIRLLEEGL